MMAAFIIVVAMVLMLMNSYPLIASRQMIFNSKELALKSQAAIISASLAVLETYTVESIGQVMALLDVSSLGRVVVTDAYGNVMYEALEGSLQPNYSTIDWCISSALGGNDCVWLRFDSSIFYSSVCVPVMPDKAVTGSVYLFEADETQGDLLTTLKNTLLRLSAAVCAAALLISALLSETITRRLRLILEAIKQVREGEYSYRIKLNGRDEVALLGREFNSLTERLQRTEEVRRRFVSDASHELKTPLAAIRLLSDSILQNPTIDPETTREFITDIGNESDRLARTTDKLLRLTRFDNGITSERTQVMINEVVDSALRILRPLADGNGIVLNYRYEEAGVILANKDDIYQIVFNLVENAIKYNMPKGSVDIIVKMTRGRSVLTVLDTGIGIPEKDLLHIFDRFYRVDKARSREAGGSGLGLSIVRDLVQVYGGEISVRRREEHGMEFTVKFPLYKKRSD